MKTDSHSHSIFSPDGHIPISEMAKRAIEANGSYLAVTDHCDRDVLQEGNNAPDGWGQLELAAYFEEYKKVKNEISQKENKDFYLAFGIEAGYDEAASKDYVEIIKQYPFDVVINSVHFVEGYDVYFPMIFDKYPKDRAYTLYLEKVLKSLDVEYRYDIVGHIGYCTRNASYPDPVMHYDEFEELLEKILKKIIEKGKTLEVNTHHALCPNREILEKYYAFGGRKISFGSDAHRGDVYKDYDETVALLKGIGFKGFTYFIKGQENFAPFE